MAFLTLNGWTIPIKRGGEVKPEYIGDTGRAFDGTHLRDRRAIKRQWHFETIPLNRQDALALMGLLDGLGQSWHMADGTLYSGKGLSFRSTVGSLRHKNSGSEHAVKGINGYNEAYHHDNKILGGPRNYAMKVEAGATNLLPADARDAEGAGTPPNGFNNYGGASNSADTSIYMQGSQSVKFTASASGRGWETDATASQSSGTFSACCYVYTTSTTNMSLRLIRGASTVLASNNFTPVSGAWERIEINGASLPATDTLKLRLETLGTGGVTVYADQLQIEENSTSTSWVDGTRGAGNLAFNPSFLNGSQDFTIGWWAKAYSLSPSTNGFLFVLKDTSLLNRLYAYQASGTDDLTWGWYGNEDANTGFTDAAVFDQDWNHYAITFEGTNYSSGTNKIVSYINGVATTTRNDQAYPDFSTFNSFEVGHSGGAAFFDGLIDGLYVVPYAMPAAQITAWTARQYAYPEIPLVEAAGDFWTHRLADDTAVPNGLSLYGTITGMQYHPRYLSGAWQNTAISVKFTLDEQ